jgi:hypothetical protein
MNSFFKFIESSPQFLNLSSKMFNRCYKLDHFAYRSFNMAPIAKRFMNEGYQLENDKYEFANNVSARWLSHARYPSLFVSQYNGTSRDLKLKQKIKINLEEVDEIIKCREKLTYSLYKEIASTNQYLAWTLLFENKINHVAFQVADIEEAVRQIKTDFPEYQINNPEDPIQVSQDGDLMQFSIKADMIDYKFNDGIHKVPFSFTEFVERKNGRRGFETQNASKIFESTKVD